MKITISDTANLTAAPGRHLPENRTQTTPTPSAPRSRGCRASWNAMKPRIQCVPTPWNPGSRASGRRVARPLRGH